MGRHVATNFGARIESVAVCRKAGIAHIPQEFADDAGLALPNITVDENGAERVYRLPLEFASIVRRIFEEGGRAHAQGLRTLPHPYTLGIRHDGAFAVPD